MKNTILMSSPPSNSVASEYVFNRGDGEAVMVRAERAVEFPEDSSTAVNDETGHVAWQAMPVLCYFILSERGQRLMQNARVMELGAGIGVPGLLAARVCRELILTDSNEAVVERLKHNVELNVEMMSCSADSVRVLNVAWGADSLPPAHVIPRHSVDVVLGSDVVYSASSARAFLETAKSYMDEVDSTIVLAYIPRWPAVDRALHDAIKEEGLVAEFVPLASFLPSVGDLSPDKAPLPKGTCLLLVRKSHGFHGVHSTQQGQNFTLPQVCLGKLRIGPEHIDDTLVESCCRAGLQPNTPSVISVEVDATGPISVTPLQAEALSRALCSPPLSGRVSELCLKECWLGDEGWSHLAPGLSSGGCAQKLSVLSATGDEIGQAAAGALSRLLPDCIQLSCLCLKHNPLGDAGALALASGLASTTDTLTSLTLSHCCIGDAGVTALARILPQSLAKLDVSSNEFTTLGLADIATALRLAKMPALTHLNISGNEVGPGGGAELAEALPIGVPRLELLDLRGCSLADCGVVWLSPALPLCREIRVLNLGSNGAGDVGVTALAEVLPDCPKLKHLGLAMNSVTGDGAWALAEEMIHEGSSIVSLNFKGNALGDDGASAIADILAEVPTLENVNLANNEIEEEGGVALAECFEEGDFSCRSNPSSLTIVLESNPAGVMDCLRSRLENAAASASVQITIKLSPINVQETGYGR